MAWTFTSPEPTFDSGIFSVVANVSTAVPNASSSMRVVAIYVNNTSGTMQTFTLTNTAGDHLITAMEIYPGAMPPTIEWTFRKVAGLKAYASGAGLNCQIEGYHL